MVWEDFYKEVIMTIEQKIENEKSALELALLKKAKKQIKDNAPSEEVFETVKVFSMLRHV